jgi:hypothetical protein
MRTKACVIFCACALGAERIDVLLRNVRGRVRFRASLAPVLRLLEARPARQPLPPSSP